MSNTTLQITDHVLKLLSDTLNDRVELFNTRGLGGGCINQTCLLETSAGRFFLKWSQNVPADMFTREAESLNELRKAAANRLIIPLVVLSGTPEIISGFLLLEYLEPGRTGNDEEKLGQGLAQIHEYSGSFYGFYHDNYCGMTPQDNTPCQNWPAFYSNQRLGKLLDQLKERKQYSAGEIRIFEKLRDRIPCLLPQESKPVLIHGDLWAGNYLHTGNGPALIDPASYYADREMEYGIMTLFGGFSTRFWDAYNEANPLPRGWRERNGLYQLYHVLNHYLLFGGGYGRQAVSIAQSYL